VFEGWTGFFQLLGTAAGSLIGLLFVVVTLTSNVDRERATRGASLYLTPTLFHFGAIVVVSAIALAPRLGPGVGSALIGAGGLLGAIYTITIAVRLRIGHAPEPPHWSDHWCYGVGPAAAYVALVVGAIVAAGSPTTGAATVGAVTVGLLVLAIRNAWDLITWLAPRRERA
jgi:hypothetical protein